MAPSSQELEPPTIPGRFNEADTIVAMAMKNWVAIGGNRSNFPGEIIKALAKAGRFSEALRLAHLSKNFRASKLRSIATEYAKVRDYDAAIRVAETIKSVGFKAHAMTIIIDSQIKARLFDEAKLSINRFLEAARSYKNEKEKIQTIKRILPRLAKVDQLNYMIQIAVSSQNSGLLLDALENLLSFDQKD